MVQRLYKVLQKGWNHNGFQWILGHNVLEKPIVKDSVEGLYLCESVDVLRWINQYEEPDVVCRAELLPQSNVLVCRSGAYKTDRCILSDPTSIEEFIWLWYNPYVIPIVYPYLVKYIRYRKEIHYIDAVHNHGHILKDVPAKEQHQNVVLDAVHQNGLAIQHSVYQPEEYCLEAVRQNGIAIHWIRKQTPELCLEAVQQNGLALAGVRKQTPEICFAAVHQNGYALQYVKCQTISLCLEAMRQTPKAEQFLTNEMRATIPSFKLIRNGKMLTYSKILIGQTDDILSIASSTRT